MKTARVIAVLLFVVYAQAFGYAMGCAELKAALGESDQVNDPHDDATLYSCRLSAKSSFGIYKDAGAAWSEYMACTTDAGFR